MILHETTQSYNAAKKMNKTIHRKILKYFWAPAAFVSPTIFVFFQKSSYKLSFKIHQKEIWQTLNVTMKTWSKESDFFIFILSMNSKFIPLLNAYFHTYTEIPPPTFSFIKGNRRYWNKQEVIVTNFMQYLRREVRPHTIMGWIN